MIVNVLTPSLKEMALRMRSKQRRGLISCSNTPGKAYGLRFTLFKKKLSLSLLYKIYYNLFAFSVLIKFR
jgi:hypothetical protein